MSNGTHGSQCQNIETLFWQFPISLCGSAPPSPGLKFQSPPIPYFQLDFSFSHHHSLFKHVYHTSKPFSRKWRLRALRGVRFTPRCLKYTTKYFLPNQRKLRSDATYTSLSLSLCFCLFYFYFHGLFLKTLSLHNPTAK